MSDLNRQLSDYLDARLAPDAMRLLCDHIAASPAAARDAARFLLLHTTLTDLHALPANRAISTEKPRIERVRSWELGVRSVAAIAALLVIAAALFFVFLPSTPHSELPTPHSNPPASFAILSDVSNDAQFENTDGSLSLGSALTAPIKLTAGKAQLMFNSTAVVDLTGPCEFEMTGLNRGRLMRGDMNAFVPPAAHGFSVELHDGTRIVDLGTAFRVIADARGQAVGVKQGRVELHPPVGAPLMLAAGDLAGVDEAGAWVRAGSLASLLDTPWAAPDKIAPLMGMVLRNDAAVMVYESFDDGAADGRSDAAGRALKLNDFAARPPLSLGEARGQVTLAAWVRLDPSGRPIRTLAINGQWMETGDFAWDMRGGCVTLAICAQPPQTIVAPVALAPGQLGRWVHVASVYDGPGAEVRHYLNGQCVLRQHLNAPLRLKLDALQIGQWTSRDPRPLRGDMDDLFIAQTALSDAQIHALWRLGSAGAETSDSEPNLEHQPTPGE
ncbi:MAG: hypothetical protein GC162_07585 [Planctomycetes bacterium]|nr:hypothetical protein [Planctomycetota bacterium]